MKNDLDIFARKLADKPLPVAENRFATCQRLLKYNKRSLAAAADLIMLDPALSMLVLRRVNRIRSKSENPLEISSVISAINLMGENAVSNLIGHVSVLEHKITDEKTVSDYYQLLDRSLHAAEFSNNWAKLRNDPVPEEPRVAALLRDIGELALCVHHHDIFEKIRLCASEKHISQSSASIQVLGFSLLQLSEQLAQHWFLADIIIDAMNPQRYHFYRAQGVMLASECVRLAEFGWHHRDMAECQALIADYLNISPDRVCRELYQTTLTIARQSLLHAPPVFAAQLVQEAYEVRECADKHNAKRNAVAESDVADTANPSTEAAIETNREEDLQKIQRSKIYAQGIEKIKARAISGESNATELINTMIDGLHKGVNMQRVAFAMFDAGRENLSVKMSKGVDAALAKKVRFSCVGNTLFTSLMKKPGSVWINAENFIKFRPLIPDGFFHSMCSEDFICTSLFCGNRPLGLVYSDCVGGEVSIDEQAYKETKSLVFFTGKAISQVSNTQLAAKKRRASQQNMPQQKAGNGGLFVEKIAKSASA